MIAPRTTMALVHVLDLDTPAVPTPTNNRINPVDHFLLAQLAVRADASESSTATSTTSSPPFFQSLTPSPSPDKPDDPKNRLAKTVLEYLFLVLAMVVVGCIVIRRYTRLRARNRPVTNFFSFPRSPSNSGPRDPYATNSSAALPRSSRYHHADIGSATFSYPYFPSLTPPQNAYFLHGTRRTQAADLDASGRRGGATQASNDHDGLLTDKDILPAYDNFGGPPKYTDLEMQSGRTHIMGVGAVPTRSSGEDASRASAAAGEGEDQHPLPTVVHQNPGNASSSPVGGVASLDGSPESGMLERPNPDTVLDAPSSAIPTTSAATPTTNI